MSDGNDNPDNCVFTFAKNSREEIRAAVSEWEGRKLVALRVWYRKGDQWLPSREGVTLSVKKLADLRSALDAMEAEVTRRGWGEAAA